MSTVATVAAPAATVQAPATMPAATATQPVTAHAQPAPQATAAGAAVTPISPTPPADAAVVAPATVAGATQAAPAATNAAPATTAAAPKVSFPVRPATTAQVASPLAASPAAADAGSIGGALFSLVLVVGLILGLGWLARRMPGLQRGASASQLKVVASVSLGPRERAVVVDVGGQQLLVGVGQGGVRTLHVLEQPLPAVEANTAPSPFAQVLAQHFGRTS